MSIYDCFMAYNELDMIELRLNILKDAVDHFVIVEAGMTHSGHPKPSTVGDALQTRRFAPFADQIIYCFIGELEGADSWARERYHRAQIGRVLQLCAKPEDWVIVGDADEIPRPEAIQEIVARGIDAAELELDFYYYDFNHRVKQGWSIGMCQWFQQSDANKIRTSQFLTAHARIEHAGWHLSYFMTPEKVVEKLDSFMHHGDVAKDVPRDPAWLGNKMRAGEDIFERGLPIEYVSANGNLPRYVGDHIEKYRALGWIE